jgi:proteasome lid subunit RPN8/RPN11
VITENEQTLIEFHAMADFPREACGVVLVSGLDHRQVYMARNVSRDAEAQFEFATEDMVAIGRYEAEGWRIAAVYHSHVDAPAVLSYADRADAVENGVPRFPGADYIVVSVYHGRIRDVRTYAWDEEHKSYLERTP